MKLRVKIDKIYYYNEESNWASFLAEVQEIIEKDSNFDDFKVRCSGTILVTPDKKSEYILIGDYILDEKWGWQLKVDAMFEEVKLENSKDKIHFLSTIVTEKQLKSLYDTFEDPYEYILSGDFEKLTEAKGVGKKTAERIINKYNSIKDLAPAYNFFRPLGVSPLIITKLCEVYKSATNAISKFKKNPYILVEDVKGIGFLKADEIALKYNIPMDSEFRISSGISYIFKEEAQNNGSTWMNYESFCNRAVELLKIPFLKIKPVLDDLIDKQSVYYNEEKSQIALGYYYRLELKIVNKIKMLQNYPIDETLDEEINKGISKAEEKQGFEFTDEQKDGLQKVINSNVSLIVGLAGTGKTSVIKGAFEIFPYNTIINQCAFSGQASKRMNEATGMPASTIHRLLKFQGEKFTFDEENPLPIGVYILDEVSMVGLELFWSLIRAIPTGSKLIMLGDNGQLPPIGIGNLLSDLMSSEIVSLIELTKIHRQASKSAIITTSQRVRNHTLLLKNDYEGKENYGELKDLSLYAYQDRENLFPEIIDTFMKEYNNGADLKDIQIIVAQNQRVALAREQINNEIQRIINPRNDYYTKKEINIKNKQVIREGDKIINRENHYDVETPDGEEASVYNGSMGIVKAYMIHIL